MTQRDDSERQIIPFATVLQQVAKGSVHNELSELLADLTADVYEHQKPGTLTVVVKLEPTKGGETLTVSVTPTVKGPRATQASIFFASEDGQLTRQDPRQIVADVRALGIAKSGEIA